MTNYVEDYSGANVPLYGSQISRAAEEPYEPPRFTDITQRCKMAGMKILPQCSVIEMRVSDFRTGWRQTGNELGTSASTAWASGKRLLLPPLVKQTTLATAMNKGAMFYCHVAHGPGTPTIGSPGLTGAPSALVMGGGNAGSDTYSLFTETNATSAVPLQYSNAVSGVVVSLSALPDKPAGGAFVLAVGMVTTATEVYGAAGGQGSGSSTGGAMHANTANCWGIAVSNINSATPGDGTLVIYAGTSIYTLATSANFATAPTQVLSGIPSGGSVLGIDALQKNWLNRVWMVWPKISVTGKSAFSSDNDPLIPLDVVSLNLEGTGPELIPTTLNRVIGAVLWNRQIVMWDGLRLVAYDGERETDLLVMEGRQQNSNFRWEITNVTVDGPNLYAWITRADMTVAVNTVGASVLSCEKYLGTPGKFTNISQAISAANSFTGSALSTNNRTNLYGQVDYLHQLSMGIPISKQTGFCHLNMANSTKWDRFWLPPPGVDPFLHFVKTGSTNYISQEWAPSAVWTSSKFQVGYHANFLLGYFHNLPCVVAGVSVAEMDIAAGGSDATVKVEWATQDGTSHTFTGAKSRTFDGATPYDKMFDWWLDNATAFTQGQFQLTLTQGSDVNKTMNASPIIFYIIVNHDGKVRTPLDAGFMGWQNEP